MIVLDASAVVEVVLGTPKGRIVAERIADPAEALHAPHLLDVEVAQALRRYVRNKELDAATAKLALDSPIELLSCVNGPLDTVDKGLLRLDSLSPQLQDQFLD